MWLTLNIFLMTIILLNFSDLNKKKLVKFNINIDDYKLIYNEDKCYFLKKK